MSLLVTIPFSQIPPPPPHHPRHPRHPPCPHHPHHPPRPHIYLPPSPPLSVYDVAANAAAEAYAADGGTLEPCPMFGGYAAPWHNGSKRCRDPTTGRCNATFTLQKRLSNHGKCFPDGDFLVGRQIMWGGYGCYPGLGTLWVENRCAAQLVCENGRSIACGTSKNNGHTNCSCG